jgi:hypothetical protein
MAKFMALFVGKPGAARPDAATVAKGMQAWGEWMARHADHLVDTGGPLGGTKKISPGGITDIQNSIGGYVIVEAEDHAAAARMFEGHPQFTIFPGEGVELMPILAIPTGA